MTSDLLLDPEIRERHLRESASTTLRHWQKRAEEAERETIAFYGTLGAIGGFGLYWLIRRRQRIGAGIVKSLGAVEATRRKVAKAVSDEADRRA